MFKSAADKKRLLVADDDESFLHTTARMLRMDGYDVTTVDDGNAALAEISRSSTDLAILDIKMPGNRGLELVQAVADHDEYLPVILVTGEPSMETAIRSVSLKINSYLLKPLTYDELKPLIENGIGQYDLHRRIRLAQEGMKNFDSTLAQTLTSAYHTQGITASELFCVSSIGIINILDDLKSMVNLLIQDGADPSLCRLCKKDAFYLNTIRETIQALARTRRAFKSKEIATLKMKLESILPENQEYESVIP
tara:strand:+ start:14403 stop:15158 length:756 start_codon:yes stop_codon:yes gene_type:complete